jgi:chromate transporter
MSEPSLHSVSTELAKPRLIEVVLAFLQLGCTSFGGPASHISLMEAELVRRRNWLTHVDFVDLFGAASLLPGPTSTELAMLIGQRVAGLAGLVAAGLFFTAPAVFIITILAFSYVRYGSLPAVHGVFYGIKPVVVALILNAVYILSKSALTGVVSKVTFSLAFILACATANPLPILIFSGMGTALLLTKEKKPGELTVLVVGSVALVLGFYALAQTSLSASPSSNAALFGYFCRIGATVFGSGYVLVAFIKDDMVSKLHWLTNQQLLDAITVGQITPGPLFATATFIGYVLHGVRGAVWATVGVFLPSFVYVLVSGPLIPKLKRIPLTKNFLSGVNAAALALVTSVGLQLGMTAVCDYLTASIATVSLIILVRYQCNPTLLLLVAAALGCILR